MNEAVLPPKILPALELVIAELTCVLAIHYYIIEFVAGQMIWQRVTIEMK